MRKGNTWQGQEREDKRKLEDTWLGEGSKEDKEGSEEKMRSGRGRQEANNK